MQFAAWVTVTVCPAITILPVRGLVLVLADAVYFAVKLPDPVVGATMSQFESLDAVQVQPSVVDTERSPVPPVIGMLAASGETPKAHAPPTVAVMVPR